MPVVVESPDEILADLASLNGAATSAPVDSPDDILADLGRAKDDYMREYAYKLGGVDPKQRDVTYKNLAHTYRQEFKEEPDQAKFEKMLEKPFAGMPVGRVLQDKIQQYSKPELTSEHPAEMVVRRLPFVGAAFSTADSIKTYHAAKRIEAGEWTEEDVRNVAGFIATQQDRANDSWGKKTLDIVTNLPGYGIEFAITGGAFTAGRKATEKLAGAALGKAASTAAGRVATRAAGFAGGVAAQTLASPHRVAQATAERLTPQAIEERPDGGVNLPGKDEDLLTALPKGFLDTFIELGSEQAGAALVKPLGKVKQFLKHRWIGAAAGRTPQQFQKILDTAGWHGVLGEMFEERVGDVARSATGLQSWQEAVPTVEQLLSEAVAFSVPGAIGYAASWAQQNPEAAAKIAEQEAPSRKSFDEAGLPQMDAMQRKQFAAKLREALRQPKTFSFEQPVPQPQPQEPSNVLQQQVAPVQEPVQEQPAPGPQPAAQENVQVQPQVLEPPAPQQAQQAQQATATLPAVTPQVAQPGAESSPPPPAEPAPPAPAADVPSAPVEPPAGSTLQEPVKIPKDRKGQIKALEALGYNQIYAGDLTTPQREERLRLGTYSFQPGDQVKLPTYKGADSTGVIRAVRPDGTYDVLVGTDRVLEKQPWYTMTPTGVRVVNPPEPQRTVKDFTKRKSRKMAEGTTPKAMLDEAVRQHAGEDPVHQGTFRMFVGHAYEENRMLLGEQVAAMAELRSAGLSKAKISKWEEAGKDYSEWPGLDDFARSFAGEHPGIGLPYPGQGEERLGGRDPANYPEELWNWIKRAPERLPPKHSDEVIRRANQLFQDNLQYIQREQGDGGRRIEGEGQGVGEGQVEEAGPEAEAAGVPGHRGELPGRPSSEEERFELEQEPASGVTEPRQREPGEDDEPFEDTGESGGLDDVPFSPTARPTDPILGSSANHAMPMRLDRPTSKVKLTGPHEVIEAMADATEAFGRRTPFRTKRISERTAAGIFKVGPEVVRIRQALDIPVAAHEMAHALEKIVFGWPKGSPWRNPLVSGPLQKELLALGKALYPGPNPPVGGWKREGWAEYVRMWLTIPANAQKYAPKLTDWFESEFLPQHPAGAGALQEARERARRWQEQGSYQRGKATTVDTGTIGQRAKRAKEAIKKGLAIEQHIDMLEPYRLLVEQIEERSGKKLSITEDPYRTGKALRRTHEGRTRAMVEQGMIDLAGNIVGPALSDIRKIVQPSQYTDFVLYLRARRARALWLDKYGPRDPGMTLNDAQQIIKEVETPELQIAAQKFYDWNDGVLNYAAQASPTFAAIVTRIRQRDPGDYAPLYRVFEDLDERINRRPGGVSAKGGSITARLRGSGRRVKDPFQQAISNASRLVRAAHDRLILDQLIRLSRREGAGNIIEEVPREKIPAHSVYLLDLLAEVEKRLSAQNIDLDVDMDAVSNELVTFFEHAKTPVGNDPIIPIVQQGEIKWYYVRKDLYEALTGMDGYRLPAVVDLIHGPFHRAFKAGTVGVRASFSLITNPARDVQNLYLQTKSKANAGKLFTTWIQSVGQAALHKFSGGTISDETLDLFERLGGQIALPLGEDIPETRRAARRVFQGRVVRVLDLRNTWDWLREVLQFPESATRATEIKLLGEDIGWKPGQPMTVEQSLELLLAAKEVTTDFSAAGKFARVMNQIVPFYNANIQGPRASWRALRRTPTTFLWRGAQLAAISLLLWWKYRDEEWWKELEPREKYTHWHFPVTVGDREELVRLPISPGINSIFSTLPVALADAWYKQSPKEASEWFENFVEGSNPAGLPVLAREAGEQLANRDFYTEKPIVTGEMQGKPAAEQQNEYTSQVAVFLGKQLGWSPARIDHAIRGIGGGVARDVVEAVGLGGRSTKRADEPANLPVIGRLFSRGGPLGTRPKSISQLYDTLGEAQTRQRSSEEPETPKERALRLMLNDAATAVSALLYARSQSGKTEDRRQITEHATAIARQAVSQYQKGDVRRSGLSIVDERLQEIKTIRKRGFEEEADRRLQALAKAIGGRTARLRDSP